MAKKTFLRELEEQVALYALDALPAEEANSIHQRIASGCSLCRQLVHEYRQTVAMLPLSLPEMPAPEALRQRILDRVAAPANRSETRPDLSLVVRAEDTAWESTPIPGVELRQLLGSQTMLVRMAPGTAYPEHDHPIGEQCLVLEGTLSSAELTVKAGDFTYFPPGSIHSPLYTETGCLPLVAYH